MEDGSWFVINSVSVVSILHLPSTYVTLYENLNVCNQFWIFSSYFQSFSRKSVNLFVSQIISPTRGEIEPSTIAIAIAIDPPILRRIMIFPRAIECFLRHAAYGVLPRYVSLSESGGKAFKTPQSNTTTTKKKRARRSNTEAEATRTSPRFRAKSSSASTTTKLASIQEDIIPETQNQMPPLPPTQEVNIAAAIHPTYDDSDYSEDLLAPTQKETRAERQARLSRQIVDGESSDEEEIPGTEVQQSATLQSITDLELDLSPNPDPSVTGTDYVFGAYDEAKDSAAQEFSFHDRVVHYMRGRNVTEKNRAAVELCILCEAGTAVVNSGTTDDQGKATLIVSKYKEILSGFDSSFFSSDSIKTKMSKCLKYSQGEFNGATMWTNYAKFRKEARKIHASLPATFSTMKSGEQLCDVFQRYVINTLKSAPANVSTVSQYSFNA